MKFLLIGIISWASLAANALEPQDPVKDLLSQMIQATEQLDYELSYIRVRKNSIEPLRYRHAVVDGNTLGQVAYLTGPFRETIRYGDQVSYFEPGIEPFSIASQSMVVPLPSIMHTDIENLATMYDFVSLGKAREADLATDVIRVSPKDGERYSFLLWIDQKSKLLVRSDLLDRNGDLIEQYRGLSLTVSPQIAQKMEKLAKLELPAVVQMPKKEYSDLNWEVTELPEGFKPVLGNRHRVLISERPVESLLFSDGLFSFSVYLAKADRLSIRSQFVRKGSRTLHSHVMGNVEITVVGDIPPETAKKVAESVHFKKEKDKSLSDNKS